MGMSGQQRAQNKQVERALQQFQAGRRVRTHCVGILLDFV
jgi:hypothetical protein